MSDLHHPDQVSKFTTSVHDQDEVVNDDTSEISFIKDQNKVEKMSVAKLTEDTSAVAKSLEVSNDAGKGKVPRVIESEPKYSIHEYIYSKAKRDGRLNAAKELKFLSKLLIPVFAMSSLMFMIFSIMSWSIPHVLCESYAKSLSVRFTVLVCPGTKVLI
jgi:hypothetical protein